MSENQENKKKVSKKDSKRFLITNFIEDARKPDREKAWHFYHKTTLPTRKQNEDGEYVHSELGETDGELYPVWGTRLKDIGAGNFGLGIGLYFRTLAILCIVFFLLGVMNIYSMAYYRSEKYSGSTQDDLSWTMRGSAICHYSETVCLDLACDELGTHNLCMLSGGEGACSLLTVILMFAFLGYLGYIQDKTVEAMDIAEQTAQDYSIVVNDPDDDAYDPDEWENFFKQWGQVAYVTVGLDNGPLLEALVERRFLIKTLNEECESNAQFQELTDISLGQPLHEVDWKTKLMQAAGLKRDLIYYRNRYITCCAKIEELEKATFKATKVYVIFETEDAQRACLSDLTTGQVQAFFECAKGMQPEHLFRGDNVLNVNEAEEAEEVLWQFIHIPPWRRFLEFFVTFAITLVWLMLTALVIKAAMSLSTTLAAILVSVFNGVSPVIITAITQKEQHPNFSLLQKSLLLKLVIARWATTAIIIWYIQPFDKMLSEEFITKISAILWADAFTTPIARVVDAGGRLKRHVISRIPKLSRTQAKLEKFFTGTTYNLAERYTDMTKTLFVSLFYIALYPQGLFITSLAFFVMFWADKYCLFRIWRCAAKVDASLTEVSRGHIALALFLGALITLHFYAGWPFDNLCPTGDELTDAVASTFNITNTEVYETCSQEPHEWFLGVDSNLNYMNVPQMRLVKTYSVFCFLLALFLGLMYFGKELFFSFRSLFFGVYKPVGDSQNIDYHEVSDINAYVPNISSKETINPFLACDLSEVDPKHVGFTADYSKLNLNSKHDLPHFSNAQRNRIFSAVKEYKKGIIGRISDTLGLA